MCVCLSEKVDFTIKVIEIGIDKLAFKLPVKKTLKNLQSEFLSIQKQHRLVQLVQEYISIQRFGVSMIFFLNNFLKKLILLLKTCIQQGYI